MGMSYKFRYKKSLYIAVPAVSGLQRSTVTVLVLLDHKTIHSASFPTNLQAQRLLAT